MVKYKVRISNDDPCDLIAVEQWNAEMTWEATVEPDGWMYLSCEPLDYDAAIIRLSYFLDGFRSSYEIFYGPKKK